MKQVEAPCIYVSHGFWDRTSRSSLSVMAHLCGLRQSVLARRCVAMTCLGVGAWKGIASVR